MFSFDAVLKRKKDDEKKNKNKSKDEKKTSSSLTDENNLPSPPKDTINIPSPNPPSNKNNVMIVRKQGGNNVKEAPAGILPPSSNVELTTQQKDEQDYPLPEFGITAPINAPNIPKGLESTIADDGDTSSGIQYAPPTIAAPSLKPSKDKNKGNDSKKGMFGMNKIMSKMQNAVTDMIMGEEDEEDDIESYLNRIDLICDDVGEALEAFDLGNKFDLKKNLIKIMI